ncbi:filamentous hemagglutinin N-terminal domain-containing protein [uncultured Phenylobacterium sp.]|uniref:two-partner secretion domain-containing protein n=1 Tax=uncultured Phenylobacterium sp. TaxID=349273 RepID=UPI0025E67CF7|nr:filamentous hemagglutinin N-terminal domain-containing protein [uncultured Phenylobacterium sp.]
MGRRRRPLALSPGDPSSNRLRRRLLAASAFAVAALAPGLTLAQLTPDPTGTAFSAGGQAPSITQSAGGADISLGAPRTILTWSSFALGSDQSVVYRFQDKSWIVLNRVAGQALINGQIESVVSSQRGAGNVWFSAPGGVVFGPNAQVNVGGLLATPATVAQGAFLDPNNLDIAFTGGGDGAVELRAGAELRATGGALALVAGSVTADAGSQVTSAGASTVLYGATSDFTVRFGIQAGDLDLLDFIVPAGGGTSLATPLTLRGETVGANVFLAVVNRAEVASAVINAPGLISAQSATAERGDVVLAAGVSIVNRQPGATRLNSTTETTANFGVLSAQRDLLGGFSSPSAVSGLQLAAGRDLGLAVSSLDVGSLNAGRLLVVDAARSLTIRNSASAASAATLRTTGALTVGAGSGAINAIGRLQIDAGSLRAGQLSSGRNVVINASGVGPGDGAAVVLGSIVADDDISVTTASAAGHIVLGSARATGARNDEGPVGRNLILTARGAEADVTYGAAGGSPLVGVTKAGFSAGRDVTANVSGLLTLAGGSAGRTFTVRAGDLDITGIVSAPDIRIESLAGALTLGGGSGGGGGLSAGLEGLRITDAEFQFLRASETAGFYAGATGGVVRGDLTVQTLHLDPANTPNLFLGAGPANAVMVTGDLAPGAQGGAVTIGADSADSGWQPGRILVTGSIGVAQGSTNTGFIDVHALGETHLNAGSEIILGSPRFVALVTGAPADQVDIANDRPAGVAPTPAEQNKIWITTGELTMSASARILMQNTGSRTQPNGVLIDGTIPGAPPGQSPRLSLSTMGMVDVFGTFRDADGVTQGGLGAGLTPALSVSGDAVTGAENMPVIRFNGLDVTATNSPGGARSSLTIDTRLQMIAQRQDSALTGPTDAEVSGPPATPPLIAPVGPDEETIDEDTVQVGTGSYEIWRRKSKKPAR